MLDQFPNFFLRIKKLQFTTLRLALPPEGSAATSFLLPAGTSLCLYYLLSLSSLLPKSLLTASVSKSVPVALCLFHYHCPVALPCLIMNPSHHYPPPHHCCNLPVYRAVTSSSTSRAGAVRRHYEHENDNATLLFVSVRDAITVYCLYV